MPRASKRSNQRLLEYLAVREIVMVNYELRNAVLPGTRQRKRGRDVADDNGNFGVDFAMLDGVNDRLQIRSAAGNQYGNPRISP